MLTSVRNLFASAFDFNHATLSGAIDVVAVRDEGTGELRCTPFHVRFGKLQVLRSREKFVRIVVNGQNTTLSMKLGAAGEAYFVQRSDAAPRRDYAASPPGSPNSDASTATVHLRSPESDAGRSSCGDGDGSDQEGREDELFRLGGAATGSGSDYTDVYRVRFDDCDSDASPPHVHAHAARRSSTSVTSSEVLGTAPSRASLPEPPPRLLVVPEGQVLAVRRGAAGAGSAT